MSSITQHLKDIDPEKFQRLCFQILTLKYPGINVTQVEGSGGDKGLDIFAGQFSQGLIIWQAKCFTQGVKRTQKRQIEKSLKTALQNFKPKRWVLCVPVDLNAPAHLWFTELQRKYTGQVEIQLFQGSQIEEELIYRRNLRNAFFPGAALEVEEIRALVAKTDKLSAEQLEQITAENAEQYLRRLEERDARFTYRLTFPHESKFPSIDELIKGAPEPGLVASILDEHKRVDVFARDIEALSLDPPMIEALLKGSAVEKLQRVYREGSTEEVEPDEIVDIRSSFDFFPPHDSKDRKLIISPSAETRQKRLFVRLTFSLGPDSIVYQGVEFAVSRLGTEVIEILTDDDSLPFHLSFTFRPGRCKLNFAKYWEGKAIQSVHKSHRAWKLLQSGGEVELYDIKGEYVLARGELNSGVQIRPKEEQFLNDLLEVSEKFGASIRMISRIDEQTRISLPFVLKIARDGRLPLPAETVSFSLVKDDQFAKRFLEVAHEHASFLLKVPRLMPPPRIMETEIDTGPCSLHIPKSIICDLENTKNAYREAQQGNPVKVSCRLLAPAEMVFHRFAK